MKQSGSTALGDVRASTRGCHQHIPGLGPGEPPWVGSQSWVVPCQVCAPRPGGRVSFS